MIKDFLFYAGRGFCLLAWFIFSVFIGPALVATAIAWLIGTHVTGAWFAVGIVVGIVVFFSGWFAWLENYGEGF